MRRVQYGVRLQNTILVRGNEDTRREEQISELWIDTKRRLRNKMPGNRFPVWPKKARSM